MDVYILWQLSMTTTVRLTDCRSKEVVTPSARLSCRRFPSDEQAAAKVILTTRRTEASDLWSRLTLYYCRMVCYPGQELLISFSC